MSQLAQRLTAGLGNAYDKARAISDYFTNGKNGFVYSLNAPASDSPNALVSFLNKKAGFCQQYAAAAAVLMREANLPSRVVIGFTHRPPDGNGAFNVTTADAHSWVEVYFSGIGWIPFDPTPLTGADLTREFALPWATHPDQAQSSTAEPTANKGPSGLSSASTSSSTAVAGGGSDSAIPPLVWEVGAPLAGLLLILLLVVWGPRLLRSRQRRLRLERARGTGNPELLWLELAATATDRNALWPRTLTVAPGAGLAGPAWCGRARPGRRPGGRGDRRAGPVQPDPGDPAATGVHPRAGSGADPVGTPYRPAVEPDTSLAAEIITAPTAEVAAIADRPFPVSRWLFEPAALRAGWLVVRGWLCVPRLAVLVRGWPREPAARRPPALRWPADRSWAAGRTAP